MAKSAAEVAKKWASRLAGASEAYREGIQAVQVSPMERAAARESAYAEGVARAVSSGKWRAGLGRVSFTQWKELASKKGAERLGTGAREAEGKMGRFLTEFLPVAEAMHQTVKDMPKGTEDAAIARFAAAMRLAKQFAANRR